MNHNRIIHRALLTAVLLIFALAGTASAERHWLHPADQDGDWVISLEEAQDYIFQWQTESNPMTFAIQALRFAQGGGWYHFEEESALPLCWAAGSGPEAPPIEEGIITLGTVAAPADREFRIPLFYSAGEKDASALLFTIRYNPDELIFQELLRNDKGLSEEKTLDWYERSEGVITLVVYGGQDTIQSNLLAELLFSTHPQASEPVITITLADHSGATPDAQPLTPVVREGAVFLTAPNPARD